MIAAHERLGAVGMPMSTAQFRDFLDAEIRSYAEVVRITGVQPE